MLFIRYGLVAGIAYAIDLGGFIVLLSAGLAPVVANILVKAMAAVFGFFAHRYFTYLIKGKDGIGNHAIKYFGLALFYMPVSSIFLYAVMMCWPNPVYAKATSDVSLFLLMFLITSKFAFTKGKKEINHHAVVDI